MPTLAQTKLHLRVENNEYDSYSAILNDAA